MSKVEERIREKIAREDPALVQKVLNQLNAEKPLPEEPTLRERYVQAASQCYRDDDEVEIDLDARISASEAGAYVQAWVWVDQGSLLPPNHPALAAFVQEVRALPREVIAEAEVRSA